MEENIDKNEEKGSRWKVWAKRSGAVVFLLFLLKGLAWIAFAVAIWMGLTK